MQFRFSDLASFFSTRERGSEVRREIEKRLRGANFEGFLILDFSGVQLISFSFADEVVGRLLADRAAGEWDNTLILVANANDEVLHPIVRSLERRKLIGLYLLPGEIRLIAAPPHTVETYEAARRHDEFRTTELAAELGVTVQACNNRLRSLLDTGILVRTTGIPRSGGREFVYRLNSHVVSIERIAVGMGS